MKKLLILSGLIGLMIPFFQCRKNSSFPDTPSLLIQRAQKFFIDSVSLNNPNSSATPRITTGKHPLWDSAYIVSTQVGPAVIVPILYDKPLQIRSTNAGRKLFSINEVTHLLVYSDFNHRYHAELITSIPDSLMLWTQADRFTGIAFVEDWSGNRLHQFKYNSENDILEYAKGSADGNWIKTAGPAPASSNPVQLAYAQTTCYEISGYNYGSDDPDGGFSWSEPAGCETNYSPVTQVLAPTRSASPSPSDYGSLLTGIYDKFEIAVITGGTAIADVPAYFHCFDNSSGIDHSYTVSVCVSQSVPGTRSAWQFNSGGSSGSSAAHNVVNTGHTFLIFQENSAGTIITRNIGFYPDGLVMPKFPTEQGELRNNENTDYNISLTYSVNNTQFFAMMNYVEIGSNPGYLYDLNSNNCTTFALNTLSAGNITLNSAIGKWPGGTGHDPGDLGEDIRAMTLGPNMTRNTVENPHPNTFTCN